MRQLLLLLLIFDICQFSAAAETQATINVKAKMYFLFSDTSKAPQYFAEFKMFPGHMSEVNSTKSSELPGGYWFTELRLSKTGTFTYTFWQKADGDIYQRYQAPKLNFEENSVNVTTPEVHAIKLHETNEGVVMLNIVPQEPEPVLPAVAVTDQSYALSYMCFKNASVVIDKSFYLTQLNGFAEQLELRIPDLVNLTLSLRPLSGMKPIGYIENGVINADLPNGQLVQVIGTGIGFSDFRQPEKFIVYGNIDKPSFSLVDAKQSRASIYQREYQGQRLAALTKAMLNNPYFAITGTTTRVGDMSPQLSKLIGNMFDQNECG